MPKSIRIDNGKPLGEPHRKSISELALWLTAMGILVIFNRPRRPTDNAVVERMQRTTQNWVELDKVKNAKQLKRRLEKAGIIQRDKYPVTRLGQKTRKEVFPELYTNERKYDIQNFNILLAFQILVARVFTRKTSKIGQFSLYGHVYYLGKQYSIQSICVRFEYLKPKNTSLRSNEETVEKQKLKYYPRWVVKDTQGNDIKIFDAPHFNKHRLLNLSICQRTLEK